MTPRLSERLRDIYDAHIRNIPHSYHSQDLYSYWKEAEALEAEMESRLSEVEKLLAEMRDCSEGMQRDLAFAKTRKRQSKRSISLLEVLILNHNDVTERLAKALRGEEEGSI